MGYLRRLKKMVEKPYKRRWWGYVHTVEAKLLPQKFGDGKVLLGLQPINSRPQYYVVRIDSKWGDGSDWNSDDFRDLIEEVSEAVEDYFCHVDLEDDDGNRWGDNEELSAWPVADFTLGCSWFEWRQHRRKYRKRRVC